jgi:hypothetical protein
MVVHETESNKPEDQRKSFIVPVFKSKEDILKCRNYIRLMQMSHNMMIWEKIIKKRIRSDTLISDNQFVFITGKSTMETLFCVRQPVKNFKKKKKKLCVVFIDLERLMTECQEMF